MSTRPFRAGALLLLALALLAPPPRAAAQETDPFAQVHRLGRGVNVLGYDPIWKDPAQARFQAEHFAVIRAGGFQTVRIVLQAFRHMDPATLQLDPAWLKTLDWAVQGALDDDLNVILDLHDFNPMGDDPIGLKPNFLAFWRQVAERYRDAPDRVFFEILNEPSRGMTPALWNAYLRDALAIIRATNPTRTVIVGPTSWNSLSALDSLSLPEDERNLIVTVHYYEPFRFTHQGASWMPELTEVSGVTWGTEAEKQRVVDDFARVQAWAQAHDRPIFLGEFGAYDRGEMASRARWTAHVARTAESLGWAWAYWQFDSDFVVYDIPRGQWVEPLHAALVP